MSTRSVSGDRRVTLRAAIQMAARDRGLVAVLAIFIALAFAWNFTTPLFEAPDEPAHLQYILFVADHGRRPDLWTEVREAGTASFESPFYYLMLGAILRASGIAHPFAYPERNPDFTFTPYASPPNYFLPTTGGYDYVHFLRGFSSLFGLITVYCAYLAAALLKANRLLCLVSSAVTAFLPQFSYISGVLNNDTLATALASIAFVGLLGLMNSASPSKFAIALAGSVCALSVLAKPHTIYLLPFGIVLLFLKYKSDVANIRETVSWLALGFFFVGGWYLVYNQWRYGDPLALRMQSLIVPEQVNPKSLFNPYDLAYLTLYLPRLLFQSFLGVFGWMKIFLPPFFYAVYGITWLTAVLVTIYALFRKKWTLEREILILAPLSLLVIIIYANLTFDSNQGRYFFPALNALSLFFVFGAAELPPILGRPLIIATPIFLLLTNLYSLWLVSNAFTQ